MARAYQAELIDLSEFILPISTETKSKARWRMFKIESFGQRSRRCRLLSPEYHSGMSGALKMHSIFKQ
ncbi:hypothetical protein PO124_25045 [Bacillus licheniformis]|nr:hypothetical protein [Bacillus licheniformis]